MSPFDSARRDLLRLAPLGLTAALPPMAHAAARANSAQSASTLASIFDIRTYGAVGDGKALDTNAINAAIAAAAASGGGTVYFPAGTWLTFSIRLQSNVALYLAQGCILLAADSPLLGQTTGYNGGTYDAAEPKTSYDAYQDYGHNHWHNSLIWGEDLHDVAITGPGLIHGKGLSNGRDWVVEVVPFKAEQPGVGNKTIALKNCRNVIFRDFSILKGGHFGLLLTGVDNVSIDNLKIDTDRDGMDIDCCKNVRVSNCTVNSPWDDAICPKSSFALGYARATENVTITNCYVTGCYEIGSVLDGTFKKFPDGVQKYRTGRIKCGTESNGGFKNITISNCVFEGCQGLALESEDGALCEDITISNITMRDNVSAPLFFRLGSRLRGPKESTQVGALRRISVNNLVSSNGGSNICSILSGIPGHSLEDIHLSNIFIEHKGGAPVEAAAIRPPEKDTAYPDPEMFGPMPAQGFFLRHIFNLEMSHIEVRPQQPDFRPSFYLDEVTRVDMLAITAPISAKLHAFHLNKVADFRIAFSRAARDTQISTAETQSF
ncbi:polygalacturonase [Granulicella aggregans]|uniref:Polygalacturonase n=1 Tax=Granulicella aggregans TaxID=474949 RepID=A0A7W7ZEU4_9BACT|nr:glycoside hydrolase family 28 protein [Granulicella aggregans]MBB5058536.1 polygalacturonase [Granulicella aggregans]